MKRNVTMIDDLPELEDEKDSSMMRGIRPTLSAHQMQNPQMMPPQMQNPQMMHPQTRIIPQQQPTFVRMPVPVFDEEPPRSMGFVSDVRNKIEDEKRRIYCIEVAEHISNCPICSKFYNVDKTPYILAIVILSIVCIILLKRVLSI